MGRGNRSKNILSSANNETHISPFAKQMFGKRSISKKVDPSTFTIIKLNDKPILDINFEHVIMPNYEREYYCDEYGCGEERICRCSSIVDVSIEKFDAKPVARKIVSHLLEGVKLNSEEKVISERCLSNKIIPLVQQIHDNKGIGFEIENSYYGQEISRVFIKEKEKPITNKIFSVVKETIELPLNKRVEQAYDINMDNMKISIKKVPSKNIQGAGTKDISGIISEKTNPLGIIVELSSGKTKLISKEQYSLERCKEENIHMIVIEPK